VYTIFASLATSSGAVDCPERLRNDPLYVEWVLSASNSAHGSLIHAQPASRSRQSEAVHIIYLDNNHPALTANRRGYIELVGVDLRSPFNCQLQHLASTRLLRHPYLLSYSVSPSV